MMRTLLVEVLIAQARPTLVTVAGEIDLATAPVLRHHLHALPERSTVLELSGVRFLSAAGVTELVDLHARLTRADASMALAGASRMVRRVLTITGLDVIVALTDTPTEAVRLMGSPTPRRRPPSSSATRAHRPHYHRCDVESVGMPPNPLVPPADDET
jgi:anti-sigma B factor antagonist